MPPNNLTVLNGGYSRLPVEADAVLNGAIGQLDKCLLIGTDLEGLPYFASTSANTAEILFLLEKFKFQVLRGDFNQD